MSNYHSLQSKFSKRYQYGLTALLSYTYSRSLDYGGSAASGGGAVGNPQTVTDLAAGYGPSGFDQMHRFVGSITYELPFGKGRKFVPNGFVSKIIGGWETDGIITFASGLPFTVSLNNGVNFSAPSWPNRNRCGDPAESSAFRLVQYGGFRRSSAQHLWKLGAGGTIWSQHGQLGSLGSAAVRHYRALEPVIPARPFQRLQHTKLWRAERQYRFGHGGSYCQHGER